MADSSDTPTEAKYEILIEAEEFDDFGGWTLDSQFETEMGSPYLLAHGLGERRSLAAVSALPIPASRARRTLR